MAYLGVEPGSRSVRNSTVHIAAAGQNTYSVTGGYMKGYVDVFVNGTKTLNFTATDNQSVVLSANSTLNDKVEIIAYSPLAIYSVVNKSGDAMGGDLTLPNLIATANVGGANGYFNNLRVNQNTFINNSLTVIGNTTHTGSLTLTGNLNLTGSLIITGEATSVTTQSLAVEDSIITMAANNTTGDTLDIGFAGKYNNGSANVWTGLIRNATDKEYYFFQEYDTTPGNDIDILDASFQIANVHANFTGNVQSNNITVVQLNATNLNMTSSITLTGDASGYKQNSTTVYGGDAGAGFGRIEYYANKWVFNAGSDSANIAFFQRGNLVKSFIDDNGDFSGTANNANNLGGTAAASYLQTSGSYTISGTRIHTANLEVRTANLIINTSAGIVANGTMGTNGQVLTSNGTTLYWSSSGAGVNTDAQYIWTNNHTFRSTITFGNSTVNSTINSTILAISSVTANLTGNVAATTITGNLTGNVAATTITGNLTGNVAATTITGNLTGNVAATTITGNLTGNVIATTISGNLTGNVIATTLSGNLTGNVVATTLSGNLTGNVIATNITASTINATSSVTVGGTISLTSTHAELGNSTSVGAPRILVQNTSGLSTINAGVISTTSLIGNLTGNVAATTITGNLTGNVSATTISGNLTAVTANVTNKIQVGTPGAFDFGSNAVIEIDANGNTYVQLVVQNANTGNNASADLVVTNDSGNDSVGYVDLGINGSLYNQAGFNIAGAGDAYLYASNGALAIGTASAKEVIFHANGTTSADRRFTINATAVTIANAAALVVNSSSGTAGQILTSNGTGAHWSSSANNALNLGGTAAASYQLNSTLNANIASYLPTYTGTVNASLFQVGTNFTANSTQVTAADLLVTGNLIVNGTTVTLNTATLDVKDLNITLAKGTASAAAANGAGITVDAANAEIVYINAGNTWLSNINFGVGNTTSNVSINSTAFVGNVSATSITGNLTGNVAATTITGNLTGNVAATTITGNLTGNVAATTITGNLTGNVIATTISGNLTGNVAATTITGNLTGNVVATTVNSSSINATSSLIVGANVTMNTTTLTMGNSTHIGAPQVIVSNTSGTTTINTNYVSTTTITGNLTGNVAAVTISGNLTGNVVATTITGNLTGNVLATTVNAATFQVGTAFTANATVVNAVSYNIGTFVVANSTVVNATHLGGTAAASYQLNSTLNANIAAYLPTYTGTVNASLFQVGTAFTANATVVNAVSYNAGTRVVANTTVVNATHLEGVAAASYVNTSGNYTVSGNLNFTGSNSTVNAVFRVVNSTANVFFAAANGNVGIGNTSPAHKLRVEGTTSLAGAVSDITTLAAGNTTITGFVNATTGQFGGNLTLASTSAIIANSVAGTSGQVLTSNGSAVYWSSAAAGVDTTAQYTWTNNQTFSVGANAIILSNATQNWMWWNTVGVAPPATTTRSAGTKLAIYPSLSATMVDYAIGIESNHMWFSTDSSISGVKWYANTTNYMTANVAGLYHTGTINAASHTVGTSFTANDTVVNAVSYNVGTRVIANTTVTNATHLNGVIDTNYARTDVAESFDGVVTFNANAVITKLLSANASFGTAGQFLRSGATTNTYWGSLLSADVTTALGYTPYNSTNPSGYVTSSGVTSITGGTGLSGGTITTTGTLSVNASYIATISANNTTYVNGKTEGNLNVNNASYAFNYTQGFNSNWNTDFAAAPAGSMILRGDTSTGSSTGGPGGSWWFQQNFRHTNSTNVWGTQVAWGWEDNANILRTRNVTSGTYGAWVTYLNSSNYNSYAPTLTGTGASGTWSINVTGSAGSATTATTATNWGAYGAVPAAGTSFGNASTIGRSDVNGYTYFGYINSSTGNSENPTVSQVIVTNGSDNFYRKASIAHLTSAVRTNASGSWGISVTGSAATFTSTAQNSQFNSLGVGTAGSGTAGEIRATNNITAYYSDKRLKKNIKQISFALDKVNKISGVTFQSNEEAAKYGYTDNKTQVGVIAQEIEAVLPEVVVPAPFDIDKDDDGNEYSKSGQDYKTVQYEKLVPLLIEAIKELSGQVEELKKRVGS